METSEINFLHYASYFFPILAGLLVQKRTYLLKLIIYFSCCFKIVQENLHMLKQAEHIKK